MSPQGGAAPPAGGDCQATGKNRPGTGRTAAGSQVVAAYGQGLRRSAPPDHPRDLLTAAHARTLRGRRRDFARGHAPSSSVKAPDSESLALATGYGSPLSDPVRTCGATAPGRAEPPARPPGPARDRGGVVRRAAATK